MISLLPRFAAEVHKHLLCNLLNTDLRPVTLGIFGRAGDGKSAQLAASLAARGVDARRVVASRLESSHAGEPGRLLATMYRDASAAIAGGTPAALIVDDVDTTVGEWENHTGTVNHLQVLAELMHIADRPIDPDREWPNRVPIFVTGNNLGRLYPPLRRPGRMHLFAWRPTLGEVWVIAHHVLGDVAAPPAVDTLVREHGTEPLAFFADVRRAVVDAGLDRRLAAFPDDLAILLKNRDTFAGLARFAPSELLDGPSLLHVAQRVKDGRSDAGRDHLADYAD
ncbi:AAA family ATPase [Dactylosporangium sp. NPDC051485]|uniref:AAA family ATPase n=1 Tax=Dactylosporangium sp. NPDC051485 TaxID=3154846 RepID=UPI00341E8E50